MSAPLVVGGTRACSSSALGGPDAPASWQGGLPITYRAGAGPAPRAHARADGRHGAADLDGHRHASPARPSRIELVIVGNHRDAWVYGGVDPSSGTASLMELARSLGALASQGVRPQRTIVFANWDAEEFTLTSSTEWGEQHARELGDARGRVSQRRQLGVRRGASRRWRGAVAQPAHRRRRRVGDRSRYAAARSPTPIVARTRRRRRAAGRRAAAISSTIASAADPTTRSSSTSSACRSSTCRSPDRTACITRSTTTTAGCAKFGDPGFRVSRARWRGSGASWRCAWPTPTSCRSTTAPYADRMARVRQGRNRRRDRPKIVRRSRPLEAAVDRFARAARAIDATRRRALHRGRGRSISRAAAALTRDADGGPSARSWIATAFPAGRGIVI